MTPEQAIAADVDEALRQRLQEAPNCGEWLESRIHLAFTAWCDDLFGEGYMTREERIGASSAIGAALDAFRVQLEEAAPTLYTRPRWRMPVETEELSEALAIAPLREGAVRPDGTFQAKLIGPGWGASGYYAPEILERDGPAVFPAGTLMLWNHPTAVEEAERPEGDMNALAARTTSAPKYLPNGPKGPGLYAEAKVYEDYRQRVNEKGPDTGLSIRADGDYKLGAAEGREGKIITRIRPSSMSLTSVDFVTVPGAKGGVVPLAESSTRLQEGAMAGNGTQNPEGSADVQALSDRQELARMRESLERIEQERAAERQELLRARGRELIREALAAVELPQPVYARLAAEVQPIITDGQVDREKTLTAVETAITRETSYLGSMGRLVEGMGSRPQGLTTETAQAKLSEAFQKLGSSKSVADRAAAGR